MPEFRQQMVELARITDKSSRFGHYYDLASDAAAGLSTSGIFHLRNLIEKRTGKAGARQPHFAALETEDVLYLLPVVTFLNGQGMLLLATIGTPRVALCTLVECHRIYRDRK